MASLIAKQKANRRYYYLVESARVEGQPRIVQQTYLGPAARSCTRCGAFRPSASARKPSGTASIRSVPGPAPRTNWRWHNLRQVGLSYVLDGENGLSLCHHVYPGNVTDADELPVALGRIVSLLDRHGIARDTVTLVVDKGAAALANTLELEQALLVSEERSPTLVALNDLPALDPRQGRVVELRFFGGLSVEETAEVLKISPDSVKRDWRLAKAWRRRELSGAGAS